MIKEPEDITMGIIRRLRPTLEFKAVLSYIRATALYNHRQLPNCVGEDTIRRQGELQALDNLYVILAGKDVFDASA